MVDFSKNFIIDDSTPVEATSAVGFGKGYIERDYSLYPQGYYSAAPPRLIPLIPRDEWEERIRDKMNMEAGLDFLRRRAGPGGARMPSLDQNGQGYCWAYSVTMCVMMLRAKMNQPYVRLSAHMVGCLIKKYRDEGGWSALALDFIEQHGIASIATWPEKSMSRANDTPEMRADAAKYKVTGAWADMAASVYDRNLTEDQIISLLLADNPCACDFNWWSHAVCIIAAILSQQAFMMKSKQLPNLRNLDFNNEQDYKAFAAVIGKRGINSWTDNYGNNGEFDLFGTKAKVNGGVSPSVVIAA